MPSSSFTRRIIFTHISGIFLNSGCSTHMSLNIFITRFLTLMPVSWNMSKSKLEKTYICRVQKIIILVLHFWDWDAGIPVSCLIAYRNTVQ